MWIDCNSRYPDPGLTVRMKWIDGDTEWTGYIYPELKQLKRKEWYRLLWWEGETNKYKNSDVEKLVETLELISRKLVGIGDFVTEDIRNMSLTALDKFNKSKSSLK